MDHDDKPVLVYATFPAVADAEAVAEAVVAGRLAACANILPGLLSIYEWQGKLQRDGEVAMIMKTTAGRAARLVEEVGRLHGYDNPAILVLPIAGGSQPFLDWIAAQTRPAG